MTAETVPTKGGPPAGSRRADLLGDPPVAMRPARPTSRIGVEQTCQANHSWEDAETDDSEAQLYPARHCRCPSAAARGRGAARGQGLRVGVLGHAESREREGLNFE